ncbi:hypothetical protein H4R35_003166 [Dimargaris xerosporica]|nr:hypothetical protein H4R35_003166 [Dimargaris xerosporica]
MRYEVTLLLLAAVAMAQPMESQANTGMNRSSLRNLLELDYDADPSVRSSGDNPSVEQESPPSYEGSDAPLPTYDSHGYPSEQLGQQASENSSGSPLWMLNQKSPQELRNLQKQDPTTFEHIAPHLQREVKAIEVNFKLDSTILKEVRQQDFDPFNIDSSTEKAQIIDYFWRQLEFRRDHGMLSIPWPLGLPKGHFDGSMLAKYLRDDIISFCELYLGQAANTYVAGWQLPESLQDRTKHAGLLLRLPVGKSIDYKKEHDRLLAPFRNNHHDVPISEVGTGLLGALNAGYVKELPNLVREYLYVINQGDLLQSLENNQNEPFYDALIRVIALSDEARLQHIFMDTVALQLIPKIIVAYVTNGYYKEFNRFMKAMVRNESLVNFWQALNANDDPPYLDYASNNL